MVSDKEFPFGWTLPELYELLKVAAEKSTLWKHVGAITVNSKELYRLFQYDSVSDDDISYGTYLI